VEGDSPTLAEHFRRGNQGPTPPCLATSAGMAGLGGGSPKTTEGGNPGPTPSVHQLVGEEEGQAEHFRRGKPMAYATSVSAGRGGEDVILVGRGGGGCTFSFGVGERGRGRRAEAVEGEPKTSEVTRR